jgi:uncharacterized ferritin-like protein (DUF455 family)
MPDVSAIALPDTLAAAAREIVLAGDPVRKVALAKAAARAWFRRQLGLGRLSSATPMPDRPGRPERPVLLMPRQMSKRSAAGLEGRVALLHAIAHIELNAVDMTWDLVGRFFDERLPRRFFDDWVQVGVEEAKHFELCCERLLDLGSRYGALPAHDGLWQAAQATGDSLIARVAIVPLVLEARGLDVQPAMLAGLRKHGDEASAKVLEVIYRDEKRHVAFGAKWFRHLCEREGLPPEPTFHALVRHYFRGSIRPPFNDAARAEAGLAPGFYKPLVGVGFVPDVTS